jgi:hypothetical protein
MAANVTAGSAPPVPLLRNQLSAGDRRQYSLHHWVHRALVPVPYEHYVVFGIHVYGVGSVAARLKTGGGRAGCR